MPQIPPRRCIASSRAAMAIYRPGDDVLTVDRDAFVAVDTMRHQFRGRNHSGGYARADTPVHICEQ